MIILLMSLTGHASASAATYQATQDDFTSVFAQLVAGDTLALQGTFDNLIGIKDSHYATAITIDASAATITQGLQLTASSGINITGGDWRHDPARVQSVTVRDSQNISIANTSFTGPTEDSTGRAIWVTGSSNITIRDNSFDRIHTSVAIGNTTDSLVTRNRIVSAASDGINIANSHRVLVSDNHCGAPAMAAGAHPDCIQLWGSTQAPQSDIVLLNNVADGAMQGFTSFNPGELSGQNIVFAGNLGTLSYPQGIACYGCKDSLFLDNTIIALPGAQHSSLVRVPGGVNNIFENNQVLDFRTGTLADVIAVTHQFSSYQPDFRAGSELDFPAAVDSAPDPAVWLQLLAGFGLIGAMARRRQKPATTEHIIFQ
ncbi:right-handed parallel beta-helix repeat-containing protein [Polymorphobacter sp.]|uniref:right-handed parallel beta-helix repeat-containing protein n=1 Tax=Polymorphobacter sp. TaxID=1909290 RepID=UPI003F7127A0